MLCIVPANYSNEVTDALPAYFECGVYFGWASVNGGAVYPMVMSIGFNEFFNNTKKTMVEILNTGISNLNVYFTRSRVRK